MGKYRTYNWGPLLFQAKLEQPFCDELLRRGKLSTEPRNKMLAGNIEKEFGYSENDMSWFTENTGPVFKAYTDHWLKHFATTNRFYPKIQAGKLKSVVSMTSLWINTQVAGEFNPPHKHGGDISFVIYLKVPKEIVEENKYWAEKSADMSAGAINFNYGEPMYGLEWIVNQHVFIPEECQIFIFPAQLTHWVSPFKTPDVERISVSGNLNWNFIK